ncbi:MAG: hypothetical protein ACXADW_22140 [Candidatus Hodarchaeales archaeon]|jgi:hypothetical protein
MVYRLSKMKFKTKVLFFCSIWIFSVLLAILGAAFITTAAILPNTPYDYQVNPLISDIRDELGPWESWSYYDDVNGFFYNNVTLRIVEGHIEVFTRSDGNLPSFKPYLLEEVRENGWVTFFPEAEILAFLFKNGTVYEVHIGFQEAIWVDIAHHQLVPHYQPSKQFPIFLLQDAATSGGERNENLGDYYSVENRPITDWIVQIFIEIRQNFVNEFLVVGQILLTTVAIGGGASIITAFMFTILRIVRMCGSKRWTFTVLKSLNGKTGRILGMIPVFDFGGESYVEEGFVNVIDLSGVRSTFREIFQRAYDIMFFPTALAAIITIFFVQNFPGDDKLLALIWAPVLTPIVLVVLLFYFPLIWSFNEGGFKRLKLSPQGDIVSVRPLGRILRDGIGIIVGFSGIFSLGALAVQVTASFAGQATSSGAIQVAGFTFDLFGIALLIFWTVGLFLILLASIIVGASLIGLNYLQTVHLSSIHYMRDNVGEAKVISNFGSLTTRFKPNASEEG